MVGKWIGILAAPVIALVGAVLKGLGIDEGLWVLISGILIKGIELLGTLTGPVAK